MKKLNQEQIKEIKEKSKKQSLASLSREYQVSFNTIKYHTRENTKDISRDYYQKYKSNIRMILCYKIRDFSKDKNGSKMNFTVDDLLLKIGDFPKCALTNRKIDLTDSSSYQLDHIIPRTKNGSNSIENCQIVCKDANMAKRDLTIIEFKKLCEDVISCLS